MSRPVEIETLKRQLAEMTRKLEKFENQTERKESLERRKRTRELIKLGATARKIAPKITTEELERVLLFVAQEFVYIDQDRPEATERLKQYADWKEKHIRAENGNISS